MIISRTPLRVDLVGDGTDLRSFCERERGSIVNAAIKKYVYIIIHSAFDKKNKIVYSKIEQVNNADLVENTRVREAMKMAGVTKGVEIHSIAEAPAGTGLGGSSSFTVGLLNALYAYQGKHVSAERLAREACEIEIDILKEPIGGQDQHAAAFGGFNKMEFIGNEVKVNPLTFDSSIKKKIENSMMLFHLGGERSTSAILSQQSKASQENPEVFKALVNMRDLADSIASEIRQGRINLFGETLRKNWEIKKKLVAGINNPFIEKYYNLALEAGAEGAKLSGAGGAGFLIAYAGLEKQNNIRTALRDLEEHKFGFDFDGSRIIYNSD